MVNKKLTAVSSPRSAKVLTFAHSPDPDDAFMFYGFATGKVGVPGYKIEHHLADIQTLNEKALNGEFEITAVSAHAYAHLSERYWVMSVGASVGRKYGPILISKQRAASSKQARRIAIPGTWTTAALVLDLWLAETGQKNVEKVVMPFDAILPAVANGEIAEGLLIHEGQLTYGEFGVEKTWDAGIWWFDKTGLPLPLGLDAVRKDLGKPLANALTQALKESILYARAHPREALNYSLQYGRGLEPKLGDKFIGMYVNEDTLNQGDEVQKGLRALYEAAYRSKLIPRKPDLTFV